MPFYFDRTFQKGFCTIDHYVINFGDIEAELVNAQMIRKIFMMGTYMFDASEGSLLSGFLRFKETKEGRAVPKTLSPVLPYHGRREVRL